MSTQPSLFDLAEQLAFPLAPVVPVTTDEALRRISAHGWDVVRRFDRKGWPYYEFHYHGTLDQHPYNVLPEGELAAWLEELDQSAAWHAAQKRGAQ